MPGVLKAKVGGSWVELPQTPSPPAQDMYRVFATKTVLDTNWPYPPEGAQAYVVADRMMWIYQAGLGWVSPSPRGYLANQNATAVSPAVTTATWITVGLGITLTCLPNRRHRLIAAGATNNSLAGSWVFVAFTVDGVLQNTQRYYHPIAAQGIPFTMTRNINSIAAGVRQFEVVISNPYAQGSATMFASSTEVAQLVIDDVGSAV